MGIVIHYCHTGFLFKRPVSISANSSLFQFVFIWNPNQMEIESATKTSISVLQIIICHWKLFSGPATEYKHFWQLLKINQSYCKCFAAASSNALPIPKEVLYTQHSWCTTLADAQQFKWCANPKGNALYTTLLMHNTCLCTTVQMVCQ